MRILGGSERGGVQPHLARVTPSSVFRGHAWQVFGEPGSVRIKLRSPACRASAPVHGVISLISILSIVSMSYLEIDQLLRNKTLYAGTKETNRIDVLLIKGSAGILNAL